MSDRKNYYFKQLLTEAELDAGFNDLENADRALMVDQNLSGIFQNAVATEQGAPSMSVDISGPGLVYDKLGQKISWVGTQVVDVSVDENSNSTSVVSPGNAKIVSIFAAFDRLLSDPRTDGTGAEIFFEREESFAFNVVQGAEATSGAEVAPALRSDEILICDITLLNAQTTVLTADIDMVTRREDVYVLTGTPNSLRAGTTKNVLQAFQDQVNAFITGGGGVLTYAGGGAWADGTTNPATTVEAQLDKVITDLTGAAGSAKISAAAGPSWFDATTNPAERLDERTDSIISDLAATSGAAKIGLPAGPTWHDTLANPSEGVQARLDSIVADLVADAGADRIGAAAGAYLSAGSVQDQINSLANQVNGSRVIPLALNAGVSHQHTNDGGSGNAWTLIEDAVNSDIVKWSQTDSAGALGNVLSFDVVVPDSNSEVLGITLVGQRTGTATVVVRLVEQSWSTGYTRTVDSVTGVLDDWTGTPLTLVPSLVPASSWNFTLNKYTLQVYSSVGVGGAFNRIFNAFLSIAP